MNSTNKFRGRKHSSLTIILLLFVFISSHAQFYYNQNFMSTVTVKVPGKHTLSEVNALAPVSKVINVEYIDGLGRSLQKVMVNATATGTDMVSPVEYDALGRVPKQYLPYSLSTTGTTSGAFDANWNTNQPAFY